MRIFMIMVILITSMSSVSVEAGIISTPVKQASKYIFKKFGGESLDVITKQTARAVAKYGDDCLPLLRQIGPEGFRILDRAGSRAPDILRLYRTQGDRALWIIRDPGKTNLFLRHGDDAARAMLKHPGMADNMIRVYGTRGASAMNAISRQNAQRLSRLSADGTLSRMGRTDEVLDVIIKYGDKAMEFIWKHKGALCITTVLVTFLKDPEVYIDGLKDFVVEGGREIVEPIVSEVGKNTNWTLIIILVLLVAMFPFIIRKIMTGIYIIRKKSPVSQPVENKGTS